MKRLLMLSFAASSLYAQSQDIALENTRQKAGEYLFVGISNALVLKGDLSTVLSVRAIDARVNQHHDTLLINPGSARSVTIYVETRSGVKTYNYIAAYPPVPQLAIQSPNPSFKSTIAKSALLTGNAFYISADQYHFFDDCELVEFELIVGREPLLVTPKAMSAEAQKIIRAIETDTKVFLKRYVIANKGTGEKMKAQCNMELKVI